MSTDTNPTGNKDIELRMYWESKLTRATAVPICLLLEPAAWKKEQLKREQTVILVPGLYEEVMTTGNYGVR